MINARLIYDIGCNDGDDTDFYLKKGFDVVAVDADRAMCNLVSARFAREITEGRCHVIFGAVSQDDQDVVFYVSDAAPGINTAVEMVATANETSRDVSYRKVVVPPVNVAKLFAIYGVPYYMKIDIEGSDVIPLKSIRDYPEMPDFASLEIAVSDLGMGIEQIEVLRGLGYRKFQFVNQGIRSSIRAPMPAREGVYVPFDGRGHNSGLFGRELADNWIDYDAALTRFKQMHRLHELYRTHPLFSKNGRFGGTILSKIHNRYRRHVLNDPVSWYDLHATR